MTVMVAERIGTSPSRNPIHRAGSGIGKSHPFVRSAPSFRPDLRTISAVARSGGQGWPVFGPPLQRRAASLTAASTAARSGASGNRSSAIQPSKSARGRSSKTEITLSGKGRIDLADRSGVENMDLQPDGAGSLLQVLQ